MVNNIFDKLFKDEILWGLHTTYNCDMAYSAELLLKQYKETAIGNAANKDGFAVFYNKACGLKSTSKEADARWFKDKFFFPLKNSNKQTFHAKISLIKYKDNEGNTGYRIAVYSKNHSFGYKSAEVGEVFELKTRGVNTSINMLGSYLDTIYNGASEEGKTWLFSKGITQGGDDYKNLCNSILVDTNNSPIDLYFGGCLKQNQSLGQCIDMSNVSYKDSLIITPPEFIRSSAYCKEFFERNACLYDLKKDKSIYDSSHEKVYLIKKKDGTYHLWFGSANATPHGIGISFHEKISGNLFDQIPIEDASIECLVHKEIGESEYKKIKEQIEIDYEVFNNFEMQGTLPNNKDSFANDLAQNCDAIIRFWDSDENTIISAADISSKIAKIEFELKPINKSVFEKYTDRKDLFQIIPAEYKGQNKNTPCTAVVGEVCSKLYEGKTFAFSMTVEAYYPIKGTAYVNDDTIMDLILPENLQDCVEKNPPTYSITLVSDWLQGKSKPLDEYNDSKLRWFRDLIVVEKTSVSITDRENSNQPIDSPCSMRIDLPENVELKTEQMKFQRDGTKALLSILENNSRAFLADEAGLGKTYTSTGVMDSFYEQFNDKNRPFFVFYIAPNIPLLSKNCRDIVKKSRHSNDIIDLSNLSILECARLSLEYYYDSEIGKEKEQNKKEVLESEKKSIVEYTGKFLVQQSKSGKLHKYSTGVIKTGFDEFKKSSDKKLNISKMKYTELLLEAKNQKAVDRIALIWSYLKYHANKLNGKIVLLPIAETQILDNEDNSRGSGREKHIKNGHSREEITIAVLKQYNPNMIIWDEYHRYMGIMNDDINPFMKWERTSHTEKEFTPFKALYLSATPYLSNKSDVDSDAEKRYDDWNEKDSKEKIPEFKDFAKLLAGGYSSADMESETEINEIYNQFINGGPKDELEKTMRKRMVRHERSRLQNVYEQHKVLFKDLGYTSNYAEIFVNTKNRMAKMKQAGFGEGTVNQALNMPYFGSFMYRNKNHKNVYSVVENIERNNMDPSLFLPDTFDNLPKECIGMKQLIDMNIKDDMSSIIWIPPTNPLYNPGANSIFDKFKKYSKTLVFAETIFYQRGYSYLLSRYVDEVANKCSQHTLKMEYADKVDDLIKICDPWKFEKEESLDEIIKGISEENSVSYRDVLASIAAPAVCAKRLGFDPNTYEEYFNAYFNRPGISNALNHWIENWISDNSRLEELHLNSQEEYELALLRYCAEGNLLAVFEEWIFVLNESDPVKISNRFEQVLLDESQRHTTVFPVSEFNFKNNKDADDNLKKECTFAERLVGDYSDSGSGENVEVKRNLSVKFSSPFWPMIMIAGRGAQEGMDYHEYCLRMMHLTLPTGPVSYEQRQGRIDRFRGLMVRRRVGKYFERNNPNFNGTKRDLLKRQYGFLLNHKPADNELYANYNMPEDGENYFERMLPFWDFSNETREYHILENRLDSYRSSLGVYKNIDDSIDLSADSLLNAKGQICPKETK